MVYGAGDLFKSQPRVDDSVAIRVASIKICGFADRFYRTWISTEFARMNADSKRGRCFEQILAGNPLIDISSLRGS
jgi:hypothetical protein